MTIGTEPWNCAACGHQFKILEAVIPFNDDDTPAGEPACPQCFSEEIAPRREKQPNLKIVAPQESKP